MEFASVALNTLLPKLARLLQDEYKLQTKGVRDGIEFLYSELRTMQAALEKVGEVPIEQLDKLQRIWAQDVRDLSYDMEDIVDTFMVDVAGPDPPGKKSVKRIFKKLTRKVTKAMARHEIAKEIKGIRERVREVAERRDRYKVDTITPANKTLVDPRLKALYTEATRLVGIDEAKEEVITKLALGDDYQNKRIVSIAGFGGLGKTTLAKAVYDEIGRHFDCRAFVSVSRNLDAKKLLKDMMYELDRGKFSLCASLDDIKHLIDLVHEILQKKRYLIVIDDIWNIEHWDVIVLALIENNKGSRIITTTRIIDVASKVGGCYMLKPLSPENSKNLFYGRIFGSKDKCPSNILDVSEKILKKCGGVPLAIITTSSLLANKSEDIKEWHDVCDSIGYGLQKKPGMDSMRKILLLSYYDLPSHLKTCLLYLSIFPEDYVIRKERLIWRWVAEGFVQDQQVGDQSFLEVGKSYFNELINRSLIQPAVMDLDGTPKACRVHDIVLDLIISLSMEECFITTVYDDGKLSLGSKQEVRRLSLHNYTTWPTMNMAKLRSLTIFEPVVSILTHFDAVVGSMPALSSYHLLRVLDLRDYKVKDLASMGFVGSLSHLRYLGLSKTSSSSGVDRLLVEIGKLRFLQTLDVSKTEVEEVPSSIVEGLRQLKCLRGNNYKGISLPDGLKNLTSLEVLESVAATSECIAKELGYLIQLRVLGVSIRIPHLMHMSVNNSGDDGWRAFANALVESLGKLKKIESLRIHCNHFAILCFDSSMEPLGNLRRLHIDIAWVVPAWIEPASLSCLSCLNISVCYEQRADIQVLGTLPCLRHLTYRVAYSTLGTDEPMERCVVGPDAFPCLVRCDLFIPGGMVPSMFPRGAMPKLETLRSISDESNSGIMVNLTSTTWP
ncbi:unnamed protein product [Urochloa decumbens]|uniref:AAA+ ATPase domain-containing protein n=1 Tax=Urochloa decumbens TaxID=240449 RepID=A0ABC9CPN9_9POAL